MTDVERAVKASYHHGDLPAALRQAALELVAERGAQAFSLAEAARRAGVSVSAPYRHFADREELLAAVAAETWALLAERLAAAGRRRDTPPERLGRMAEAYVRFAVSERARFAVVFGAGIDKGRHPELAAAGEAAIGHAVGAAVEAAGSPAAAERLTRTLWAVAHGHATLAVEGDFDPDEAARSARRAVRTLAAAGRRG